MIFAIWFLLLIIAYQMMRLVSLKMDREDLEMIIIALTEELFEKQGRKEDEK